MQERAIAWPDAQQSVYVDERGLDVDRLLPRVGEVLSNGAPRQLVVVHTYGAHFPYCERYAHRGRNPVDCRSADAMPTRDTRDEWMESYDAAVQESMRFLDALIAKVDASGGESFVAYVPDHGENLLDDDRGLFLHALATSTRWDTRVPFIVWANAAWRMRHPQQWSHLQAARSARLIHGDVVPTLLGAAGITYDEPRDNVVDLTRAVPPAARKRPVLRRLGEVVDGDAL